MQFPLTKVCFYFIYQKRPKSESQNSSGIHFWCLFMYFAVDTTFRYFAVCRIAQVCQSMKEYY
ncbi:MAG TPA: hypothetical protein DDW65_06170 [Firmicutes bacterium]|nr:hypothetical protein [Bacillota bacterium]